MKICTIPFWIKSNALGSIAIAINIVTPSVYGICCVLVFFVALRAISHTPTFLPVLLANHSILSFEMELVDIFLGAKPKLIYTYANVHLNANTNHIY